MPKAPKLSQQELDDEFEQFLKESFSDDSTDFTSKRNRSPRRGKKEDTGTPWWMKGDDDSSLKSGRAKKKNDEEQSTTPSSMKWLKPKKQSTPLREVQEEEDEEVLKPKSILQKGKRVEEEEEPKETSAVPRRQIRRDSLEEDNFDEKFEESHKRSGVMPEQASFEDTYSQSEPTDGLTTAESTGQDPYGGQSTMGSTGQDPYGGQSTFESTGPGAETLEEIADKAKFFKELEEKAERTVDYSRLNRDADLSGTMGTMGTLPSAYMGSPDATGPQVKKMGDLFPADSGKAGDTPAKKSSPSEKEQPHGGMLGNVALLDTMDSSLSPVKPHKRSPPGGGHGDAPSTNRGGFLQSGATGLGPADTRGLSTGGTTGELEALQAILREAAATPTLHLGDDMDQSFNRGTKERTIEDILREANEERHLNSDAQDESRGFSLEPANFPSNEDQGHRGFDLQPANQEAGMISHDSDVRGTDSDARGYALSPVSEGQEFRGFNLQPASPVLRGMDLQPAIEADIDTIDGTQPVPSQARKTISKKKSPSKPRGRYSNIRSSGYGSKQAGKKAAWSPADVGKQKVKGSEIPTLNGREDKSQGHLLASVESFASYLHDQFADGRRTTPPLKQSTDEPILSASMREAKFHTLSRERALVAEVNEWQQQWQEERLLNAKMKAEIGDLQKEYERKETELRLEHEKEMFKLKQENFVLVAKLNSQDDQDKVRRRELVSGKTPEGVSQEEQLKLMQREIIQQETLLQGYQQENERLFGEVKTFQAGNKENEARMFKENQRLQTEVGNLRELMEMKDRALRNKGIITGDRIQQEIAAGNTAVLGAGKIAELQADVKEHEVSEASLRAESRRLTQEKKELENHIEQLVREKTRQQERLSTMRDGKHIEFKDLQMKYEREMESLQKKVRWYTENQELLDRDAAALKMKDDEIAELKEQLKNGPNKLNSKSMEAKRRARERAADAKKIQDLERQVREMNDVIRRRHPNSLPALIYAAASTSSPLPADVKGQRSAEGQPRSITFLEDKVKRLDRELEGKEEESKRGLRVVEQKYNAMKVRYEDRINSLESQVEQYETGRQPQSRPHTSVTALQKELDGVRERNRNQLQEVEKENKDLRRRLAKAISSAMSGGDGGGNDGQIGRGLSEKELQGKLSHLALELGAKDKELELLKATVDRLMEERFHAMNAAESNKGKTKKLKRQGSKSELGEEQGVETKPYVPGNFTGSHISDVLMENERLKHQLDDVSLEMDQHRLRLHASLAEAESATRQAREKAAEEMALIRSHHQMEVERMKAERAMVMGDSKMARLNSQVESHQVMVRELQDQLSEARLEVDRLQGSRVRERVMETQVEQLRQELREAKENHSPEMKHFEALQAKIGALESRYGCITFCLDQ
ncbi:centrosomal protein of 162 kDa isoform X2 [Strongylocentrotus purpuratus]|uniref:Centrosomal protein of 162 kDa n=1 Tax=Strongylocentrotus purpuratus TaxID=7668 RepID=A0A7M7PFA7_STRPU|nr:centrosomal protein of 162 kDa isoform X2 [Strongylocentrotus purpuratus]